MQHKQFLPIQVKQINDEDPDYFIFEGYASTFGNVDLGDDIIQKGAFTQSLLENSDVKVLWQHKMSEPIGIPEIMREDDYGLYIRAKLPKADDFVKGRVMPQVKIGSVAEMSIGFFIEDFEIRGIEGKNVRVITKLKLFEFSLVTKAMNPKAKINSFKSFKDLEITNIKQIETFLKDGGMSQTQAKAFISKVKEFSKQRDVVEDEQCDAAETKLNKFFEDQMNQKIDKILNNLTK